jgi:hypothetical protein
MALCWKLLSLFRFLFIGFQNTPPQRRAFKGPAMYTRCLTRMLISLQSKKSFAAFFICSLKASFIQFIKFNRVLSDSAKQSGRLGFSEDADSVAALTMCSSKLFIMSEGVA